MYNMLTSKTLSNSKKNFYTKQAHNYVTSFYVTFHLYLSKWNPKTQFWGTYIKLIELKFCTHLKDKNARLTK